MMIKPQDKAQLQKLCKAIALTWHQEDNVPVEGMLNHVKEVDLATEELTARAMFYYNSVKDMGCAIGTLFRAVDYIHKVHMVASCKGDYNAFSRILSTLLILTVSGDVEKFVSLPFIQVDLKNRLEAGGKHID